MICRELRTRLIDGSLQDYLIRETHKAEMWLDSESLKLLYSPRKDLKVNTRPLPGVRRHPGGQLRDRTGQLLNRRSGSRHG